MNNQEKFISLYPGDMFYDTFIEEYFILIDTGFNGQSWRVFNISQQIYDFYPLTSLYGNEVVQKIT